IITRFGLFTQKDTLASAAIFAVLIFALATVQDVGQNLGRTFHAIGDSSYSIYLLHFPLQITLILAARTGILPINYFTQGGWCFFFALLMSLSVISYYKFESPVQAWLRGRLLSRRRPQASATVPQGVATVSAAGPNVSSAAAIIATTREAESSGPS